MKTFSTPVPWLFMQCITVSYARTWRDIMSGQDLNQPDYAGMAYLEGKKQQLFNASKVADISQAPSPIPKAANAPSPSPSKRPLDAPTFLPSNPPSLTASSSPSDLPSAVPTSMDPYPPSPVPLIPDKGYFNYNNMSNYGPENWNSVGLPDPFYWSEFDDPGYGPWKGLLKSRMVTTNVCAIGQQQSPIDVRENGAVCYEIHQVRIVKGEYSVDSPSVQKRIEPYALRLVYPRRPCADLTNTSCQQPHGPTADMPNGWHGIGDLIHIDFKIPSEHTIWGERFDAEMQLYHIYPSRGRVAVYTAMIRAQTNGYNYYLQAAINAFQSVYDENQARCGLKMRRERRLVSDFHRSIEANVTSPFVDYETWADFSTPFDEPGAPHHDRERERELQTGGIIWNPYHEMLFPSIYYYRYEGSLTEPPCSEYASYWVADKPMNVSFEQLAQMKKIQFTNLDSNCKRASVQFAQSVARPIQNTNSRPVWKCTSANFVADPPIAPPVSPPVSPPI